MGLKVWLVAMVAVAAGFAARSGEIELVQVGECHTEGSGIPCELTLDRSRLFFAQGSNGLSIVNLADPTRPTLLGSFECPGVVYSATVTGSMAYVSCGSAGLALLDVSEPTNPRKVGNIDIGGEVVESVVSGSTLYLGGVGTGVWSFDVSNPAQPIKLGQVAVADAINEMAALGNHLMLGGTNGLWSVDISRPNSPVVLTNVSFEQYGAGSLALAGTCLYATGSYTPLQLFDVSDPGVPVPITKVSVGNLGRVRVVTGSGRYVAVVDADEMVHVLERTEPFSLLEVAVEWGSRAELLGVAINETHVVIATHLGAIRVFAIHDPATLRSVARASLGERRSRTLLAVTTDTVHLCERTNLLTLARTDSEGYLTSQTNSLRPSTMPLSRQSMVITNGLGVALGEQPTVLVLDCRAPAHPKPIASVELDFTAQVMATDGRHAVAGGMRRLAAVDLSDPASPEVGDTLTKSGSFEALALAGDLVYVGGRQKLMQVFRIGESNTLSLVREWATESNTSYLLAAGDRLYALSTHLVPLTVYSLDDPAEPKLLGASSAEPLYHGGALMGDFLYAMKLVGGIDVLDVRDPKAIRRVAGTSLPIQSMVTDGTTLYANTDAYLYLFKGSIPPMEYRMIPLRFTASGFGFTVDGSPGKTIEVQRGLVLGEWQPWRTLTLATNAVQLEDPIAATPGAAYYRVIEKPTK